MFSKIYLIGGSKPWEGNVFSNNSETGIYGPICSDGWDLKAVITRCAFYWKGSRAGLRFSKALGTFWYLQSKYLCFIGPFFVIFDLHAGPLFFLVGPRHFAYSALRLIRPWRECDQNFLLDTFRIVLLHDMREWGWQNINLFLCSILQWFSSQARF